MGESERVSQIEREREKERKRKREPGRGGTSQKLFD